MAAVVVLVAAVVLLEVEKEEEGKSIFCCNLAVLLTLAPASLRLEDVAVGHVLSPADPQQPLQPLAGLQHVNSNLKIQGAKMYMQSFQPARPSSQNN